MLVIETFPQRHEIEDQLCYAVVETRALEGGFRLLSRGRVRSLDMARPANRPCTDWKGQRELGGSI
jgi:hypothetical protein